MRNSKCTAAHDRPGRSSGRDVQLIFNGTGDQTAERAFDYFSEIRNPALFLAIAVPDIKQIKQIKRCQSSTAGGYDHG